MSEMTRIVELNKLEFDPENPRLAKKFHNKNNESFVIDYMLRYGNIIELMKSISVTGYSDAEPLLVIPNRDKFIVVEGNRRLAALKLLSSPELAKLRVKTVKDILEEAGHRPNKIPCIVYEKRSDILDYLGYRHITGVKDWGPLEKARYLSQLYDTHSKKIDGNSGNIYSELAKMIGSRPDYVARLHVSLKLYDIANDDAFFGTNITDEDIDFSWIPTALGYSGIKKFISLENTSVEALSKLNSEKFKKIFIWLFDPKKKVVVESRQISELAKITEKEEAVKKLENSGSLFEALLYTSAPTETFLKLLNNAKDSLRQAKDAIEQLNEKPEETDDLLDGISKLLKSIQGGIEANFIEMNDTNISMEELMLNPKNIEKLRELLERRD